MKNKRKHFWTAEEDEILRELVQKHGAQQWRKVASHFVNRTPLQCRDRWTNRICPDINRTPFTEEDDKLLLELVEKHGSSWATIARHYPGRTDCAMKNRFLILRRKGLGSSPTPCRQTNTNTGNASTTTSAATATTHSSNEGPAGAGAGAGDASAMTTTTPRMTAGPRKRRSGSADNRKHSGELSGGSSTESAEQPPLCQTTSRDSSPDGEGDQDPETQRQHQKRRQHQWQQRQQQIIRSKQRAKHNLLHKVELQTSHPLTQRRPHSDPDLPERQQLSPVHVANRRASNFEYELDPVPPSRINASHPLADSSYDPLPHPSNHHAHANNRFHTTCSFDARCQDIDSFPERAHDRLRADHPASFAMASQSRQNVDTLRLPSMASLLSSRGTAPAQFDAPVGLATSYRMSNSDSEANTQFQDSSPNCLRHVRRTPQSRFISPAVDVPPRINVSYSSTDQLIFDPPKVIYSTTPLTSASMLTPLSDMVSSSLSRMPGYQHPDLDTRTHSMLMDQLRYDLLDNQLHPQPPPLSCLFQGVPSSQSSSSLRDPLFPTISSHSSRSDDQLLSIPDLQPSSLSLSSLSSLHHQPSPYQAFPNPPSSLVLQERSSLTPSSSSSSSHMTHRFNPSSMQSELFNLGAPHRTTLKATSSPPPLVPYDQPAPRVAPVPRARDGTISFRDYVDTLPVPMPKPSQDSMSDI